MGKAVEKMSRPFGHQGISPSIGGLLKVLPMLPPDLPPSLVYIIGRILSVTARLGMPKKDNSEKKRICYLRRITQNCHSIIALLPQ